MPSRAPCLYAVEGEWYADCVDGKRLKILKLAIEGAASGGSRDATRPITPADAPAALSNQPLALG